MTAPTRTRTRTRGRAATETAKPAATVDTTALLPDTSPATERPSGRPRSAAAQRAYARRAQREGRAPERAEADSPGGRARFVVLIIALLVVGIAATLWLSTQAIADSYRLEQAKKEATDLSERADALQREVTKLGSPAALAERARELGLVFPGEPARLVVQPDGTVVVVGEPKPAEAPAPPAPPAEQQPPAQQQPADQAPPADQSQTAPDGEQGDAEQGADPPAPEQGAAAGAG